MVKPGQHVLPFTREFLAILIQNMGSLPHEELLTIYLDRGGRVLGESQRVGGTKMLSTRYRTIFKQCFDREASAIILAHNHPSGSALPSRGDISSTRALIALAAPLELEIVDHLIVARSGVFSIRAAKKLG